MRATVPLRPLTVFSMLILMGLLATPASAHPLGNFTINRYSALEVSTSDVSIRYVVDMAEIPTLQELPSIDTDEDDSADEAELETYARRMGALLLRGVRLRANGRGVELSLDGSSAQLRPGQAGLDVLRIEAVFRGSLPSEDAELSYVDTNYTRPQKLGWKEIVAYPVGGQGIAASTVPAASISDGLESYPAARLSDPPDITSARVQVAPGAGGGAPAVPGSPTGRAEARPGDTFTALIERELTPAFFLVAIALAAGFGALHALGPGHGKTVMAAYLVGGEGRVSDAVAVGIAVSLMHTASVVVLGVITLAASNLFAPETVYPWLSLAAGVIVLGLGVWLLTTRLRLFAAGRQSAGGRDQAPVGPHPGAGSAIAVEDGRDEEPAHDHAPVPAGARNTGLHASRRVGGERLHEHRGHEHHGHSHGLEDAHSHDLEHSHSHSHDHEHEHDNERHVLDHSHGRAVDLAGNDRLPRGTLPGGAPAEHSHGLFSHTHDVPDEAVRSGLTSWRGLGAVALSGGLLPSPTALVVLLGAVALHRVAFGITLVAAFSVGLAGALTALGVLVLRARSFAARRLGHRVSSLIPLASAAAIVAVGLFLTARAVATF